MVFLCFFRRGGGGGRGLILKEMLWASAASAEVGSQRQSLLASNAPYERIQSLWWGGKLQVPEKWTRTWNGRGAYGTSSFRDPSNCQNRSIRPARKCTQCAATSRLTMGLLCRILVEMFVISLWDFSTILFHLNTSMVTNLPCIPRLHVLHLIQGGKHVFTG